MPDADLWPGPDDRPGADNWRDPRTLRRDDFPVLRPVPLRWNDDDVYGHVNNAVHYLLFDTAVNGWLAEVVGDVRSLPALGVVAETGCRYLTELRFPDAVTAGVALGRLGTSSVTYRLALFGEAGDSPAAVGRFVHVYVDPASRRPVPVPGPVRAALARLDPSLLDRAVP
jgi:acyl-CoA thioester hydrolase